MHNERFALILVDHLDPARIAEDELEPDRMVVDIVGDGAAVRNHDVRPNEPPTETAGIRSRYCMPARPTLGSASAAREITSSGTRSGTMSGRVRP